MMTKSSAKAGEAVTLVFEQGRLAVEEKEINVGHHAKPPGRILIVAPKDAGTYPIALFLHGFWLDNYHYKHLLRHVASHGFIMVAPKIDQFNCTGQDDINAAAKVADWLPDGLPSVLPKGVKPELSKLAVAGHSRGGHTAFSLALGHAKTRLRFSALIGLDPVAGPGEDSHLMPTILINNPPYFDIAARPVLVIGTGLGEEKNMGVLPACAPKGVNHVQFYSKCRPPCYYFVTKDYGHVDMLDDDPLGLHNLVCKRGSGSKDKMRRCVAGIMVAFLNAVLGEKHDDDGDLEAILQDPAVAPVTLDPVEHHLPIISKL